MTVQEEVRQRIEHDVLLAKLRKKIDSGKADFNDTFLYSDRAGKLLGEIFAQRLPDIPIAEREALCVELLRDRYTDINSLCDAVQKALDQANGLHLKPQRAPFEEARAHKIGRSTADQTAPEKTQQRRSRAATETMTRSMHDDRMQAEAKFRSRAGLKCYITRKTDGKCCAWCSAMAGRYEYYSEPKDVYRRHDNCGCSVTYENGRQRQDVWSKRTWEAPEPGAGAGEPVVFTKEQAEILALRHRTRTKIDQKSIDFFAKGGILKGEYDERDIIRAITQKSTNFVTRDINDPESVFGELVELIMPDPKYYDIKAHGSPTAVKLFGSVVDAQTLARVIVLREDYTGKPIRLLCCETGKEEGVKTCFAQQLADLLGVDVLAPTETIYASTTGRIKVESEETGKKGKMKTFTPNKRGRK